MAALLHCARADAVRCTPQAAYLALTQLLDQGHELVLLLVNTLLSDLKSDNFINGKCMRGRMRYAALTTPRARPPCAPRAQCARPWW